MMEVGYGKQKQAGDARRPVDTDALFLGPRGENAQILVEAFQRAVRRNSEWRKGFHPEDGSPIANGATSRAGYQATIESTMDVYDRLLLRLNDGSTPWSSLRYLGHMNTDTLLVSIAAEAAAMLYNPNSVGYESSIPTTKMEVEVVRDLIRLIGYDNGKAWGYLALDGTIANDEALWIARELKAFPIAVKRAMGSLMVKGDAANVLGKAAALEERELLNLPVEETIRMVEYAAKANHMPWIMKHSIRHVGSDRYPSLGAILVPSTAHYSLEKAAAILGIGENNLIRIPVDENYRMSLSSLEKRIEKLQREGTPILAVVGVVGTTEEGAVDDISGIAGLRDECAKRGAGFYFHVDAAYGGYIKSAYVNRDGSRAAASGENGAHVSDSYFSLHLADSITIDPHKQGYIPYVAGGIFVRNREQFRLLMQSAEYLFRNQTGRVDEAQNFGRITFEGSRPGAAAAGVWAAHRLLPLNVDGYGRVIKIAQENTKRFMGVIERLRDFEVGGVGFRAEPLLRNPDLNIVNLAFNFGSNIDLRRMNSFNASIYRTFTFNGSAKPYDGNGLILTNTALVREKYGDAPKEFLHRLGIPEREWDEVGRVEVLRSVLMHPWLMSAETLETYHEELKKAARRALDEPFGRGAAGLAALRRRDVVSSSAEVAPIRL